MSVSESSLSADLKAKLTQIKELHEMGLLTDVDFQKQKDALMATAMGTTPAAPSVPSLSGATRVDASAASGSAALSGHTTTSDMATPVPGNPLAGATTVDPTAGLPARVGNYRVLGIIGAGGMGTVVRARHEREGWAKRQGGDVALKLIHPHIAAEPTFQERFYAEAALGKRVQHPGLTTVYDVVSEGPWLGTILEYIEGRDLSEWVQSGGLPLDEVLALLSPLAEAIDYLHAQGIVHRDLKPANVKVRPDGRPVLLDLGIAKDLSGRAADHTQTMTAMGTSAWMAPEQADAKSVTPAADVYALGMIAYVLLSGRMPWGDGESELRVLTNKMMGKLTPLSEARVGLPAGVYVAIERVLLVDPTRRQGSAGAFIAELGSAQADGSPHTEAPVPELESAAPVTAQPEQTASPPSTKVTHASPAAAVTASPQAGAAEEDRQAAPQPGVPAKDSEPASQAHTSDSSRWLLLGGVAAVAVIGVGVLAPWSSEEEASLREGPNEDLVVVEPATPEPMTGEKLNAVKGCAGCHSSDGSMRVGPSYLGLHGKEQTLQGGAVVLADDAYLRESITQPSAKIVAGFAPSMPAYVGQLSEEEIDLLVYFIKSHTSRDTPEGQALENPYGPPGKAIIQQGQRMFSRHCASCHGVDGRRENTDLDCVAELPDTCVPAPKLSSAAGISRYRSDGYLFLTIRDGSAVKRGFEEALSDPEMWSIVSYIRTLDGAAYAP